MPHYRAIPEYYDAEYAQQDMLQADIPFFMHHLRPRDSILEIAAGTGRCAIPLAQAGHRVTGVDVDPRMLALAQQKRDSVGIPPRRLELIEADARTFDLGKKFDWAAVFFNSFLIFTTLEGQDAVLQSMRRHLKPRGHFWIDLFQPNLTLLAQETSKDLEPLLFHVPQYDRTVFKSTEVRRDPAHQIQRVIFHYLWFDANGRQHKQKTQFDLTFLFPRELQILLERNGLGIDRMYGNYDGSKLNADSPRIIVHGRAM